MGLKAVGSGAETSRPRSSRLRVSVIPAQAGIHDAAAPLRLQPQAIHPITYYRPVRNIISGAVKAERT